MTPLLLWWKRVGPWYIASLLIVQALTGILLSMRYVPSEQPSRDERGRVHALAFTTGLVRLQPTSRVDVLDTISTSSRYVLVALDSAERIADLYERDARRISLVRDPSGAPLVPSAAASSVTIDITTDAFGGAILRWIHHVNTILLLIALLLALAAFMVRADKRVTLSAVAFVVALVSAYTGRLLPDDVYAFVSRSITSHILDQEAPFGALIASLVGVDGGAVRALATTATMHTIVLPACMALLIVQLVRSTDVTLRDVSRSLLAIVLVTAVAFLVFHERVPTSGVFLPRDTMHGAAVATDVQPWWPFRLANNLIAVFGAELASYLVLGGIVALMLMPWWQGRVGVWTVRAFIAVVLLTIVLGTVL